MKLIVLHIATYVPICKVLSISETCFKKDTEDCLTRHIANLKGSVTCKKMLQKKSTEEMGEDTIFLPLARQLAFTPMSEDEVALIVSAERGIIVSQIISIFAFAN